MKLFSVLLVVCIVIGIASITKQHKTADECYIAAWYSPSCAPAKEAQKSSHKNYTRTAMATMNDTTKERDDKMNRINGVYCSKIVAWLHCAIAYAKDNCAGVNVTTAWDFKSKIFKLKQSVDTVGCKEVYDANQDLF